MSFPFSDLYFRALQVARSSSTLSANSMLNFFLIAFERIFLGRRRTPHEVAHLEIGLQGEEAAERFLRGNGYSILARRWTSPRQRGDLDLVAMEDKTLVFVEVKARSAYDSAVAEVNVDRGKRKQLRKLARLYLRAFNQQPQTARFDVLSIYILPGKPAEVEHLKSAFGWNERAN